MIKYIKKTYNVISITDLLDYFQNGKLLKPNSLLLTFDDGDISVYKKAFPLLKKYNIPAIIFIITQLINTKIPFWWEELEYYFGAEEGNKLTWELKDISNKERILFLDQLRTESNLPRMETMQLSLEQIKEMHNSVICIGNHSHTHPMFDQCTNNEVFYELKNSINFLNFHDFAPYYFAYPNGNWDSSSEIFLKNNNIKLSFLFDHKLSNLKNPLRISRIRVDTILPIAEFKAKISGLHSILYHKSL